MYQEVYTFRFKRKSHQSIGRGKIQLYFLSWSLCSKFYQPGRAFYILFVPCCFIFYDRGRVVLAAVSADSAGGVLGQSDTGGEPASRLVASSATQGNKEKHRRGNQLTTNVATVSEQQPLKIQKREVNRKEKVQC